MPTTTAVTAKTGLAQVASGQTKVLGNLGPGGMDAAYEQVHEFTKLIAAETLAANRFGRPLLWLVHLAGFDQEVLRRIRSLRALGLGIGLAGQHGHGCVQQKSGAKDAGATGYEWLSRDPAVGAKFAADPKCFYADAAKVFGVPNATQVVPEAEFEHPL